MKKIISVFLLAIIFCFIATFSINIFGKLFFSPANENLVNFEAAFFGAFFAFLFVRIGEGLTRYYNCKSKNYSALVKLQHHLNDCLGLIGDNLYVINSFLNSIGILKEKEKTPLPIIGDQLDGLPIDKELIFYLSNIDLINDLSSFKLRTRKLNDTMQTFNRVYKQVMDSFVDRKIDDASYRTNVLGMEANIVNVKKFLYASKDETIKLMASIRILLKDEPLLAAIIRNFTKNRYDKTFPFKQKEQIKKIKNEIDEISKESRDRINNIISK